MTFRVLHVCTGNICRSPISEHLMRSGLAQRGATGFEVLSAGTHGLVGQGVYAGAQAELVARGIDCAAFRAQRLSPELVASADLVLAMSREHRAAAVTAHPRAAARAFTLRELDRLLAAADTSDLPETPEDRARALVALAAGQRGLVRPDRPEDDDVPDPYGGPAAGYGSAARLIEGALSRWLELVAPVP